MIQKLIAQNLQLKLTQVTNVLELFDAGGSIPFIARYRKEKTNSLDEVQLQQIKSEYDRIKTIIKRKEYILKSIEQDHKLTPELKSKINDCWDENKLEDYYLPFKKKQTTKAAKARKLGLEGLAKIIMAQRSDRILDQAQQFVKNGVRSKEEALEGAKHIIAEWISESEKTRDIVRSIFSRTAIIESKVVEKKKEEAYKYKDYFEYEQALFKIPSHRLLAILRAESEGFLKTKINIDKKSTFNRLANFYIRKDGDSVPYIEDALKDSLTRLIYPSIKNESLKSAKEKADKEAIGVFANNVKELLLSAPLGAHKILALDPGFRTGCKLVCLDQEGNLEYNTTIYPHPPQSKTQESLDMIQRLISKYQLTAIAIGNGTAGKETYQLLKNQVPEDVQIFLVNEDGASIYSASAIAREEFPDQDITVRGAVSIGRRLMDPLAELVKIDPKSIGVGQYQHDVNPKLLKESLDFTISHCVNAVGVNINTASKHLLTHISGLGPGLAENMVSYRTDKGRFVAIKDILQVPRMGASAFEQSAGFLRIRDGQNPLDNTGVHPESYHIVEKMAKTLQCTIAELIQEPSKIDQIELSKFVKDDIGMPTLLDIVKELKKPGLDPRGAAETVNFDDRIQSIEDINIGMMINGVITNLTKFGAFVDLGIKESGLIHISQIVDRFVSDPADVLHINQKVHAKVIDIDYDRQRISLSLKEV